MRICLYLKIIPAAAALVPLAASAASFEQSVASIGTSTAWNSAIWGSPAAAPTSGNTYVSKAGMFGSSSTKFGVNVTGRVRSYGGTFASASVRIVAGTELLLKPGSHSANLVFDDGGVLRLSPDSTGTASLNGSIDVTGTSVFGVVSTGTTSLTIESAVSGTSTLKLRAGDGNGNALSFNGDLSGLTGVMEIGGGNNLLTVGLKQDYHLPAVELRMGGYSTVDRLDLSHHLTFKSFTFGGTSLAPGTYSAGELNLTFGNGSQFTNNGGSLTVLEALGTSTPAVLSRVFIAGDSTAAVWATSGVTRGWGQVIHRYFGKNVRVVDNALPGRSAKTFVTEGWWASTVAALSAGDYVLIQFGHNDSHNPANVESTDANGAYKTYLKQYIDETRAKGAIPVLVTPMHRRNFDAEGNLLSYVLDDGGWAMDLAPYAAAAMEVAVANDVPCIDLFASSGIYMQMLGNEACKTLMVPNDPTHWNELGAYAMASLVSQGLSEVLPTPANPPGHGELTQYLRRDVLEQHRADLAAGTHPRPVCSIGAEGGTLRLDWFLQSSGAIIQRSDDLQTWSNDYSGAAGSVVVSPAGPGVFFRVMTPP
jgi:lysophospholipase L1-like esterase